MNTIFMNFKNSETFDPHRLLLNLRDKINLAQLRNCISRVIRVWSLF